jgi:hypothetical protein
MANYSDIKGFTVQTLTTDPIASQFSGGTWSSGGNMNEGRVAGAGSGTQTASIFAGGTPPTTGDVELYNGSSWTETTEMNTARAELAAATVAPSTEALIFAGHTGTYPTQTPSTANEYWNGSSWTELAEVNTGRWAAAGAGASYTAALLYGGYSSTNVNSTETWNGSAWTEVNELNTTRRYLAGTGSNTAAIAIGGSPGLNAVEQWNGSSWTATTNFPTGSEYIEAAGASYTNCLALGVTPSSTGAETIHWDGSSWTELANYTTGRINGVGSGSSSAALLSGGNPAPVNASTEEFTAPADFSQMTEGQLYFNSTANAFKETITDIAGATWASGGNLNSGRRWGGQGSLGIQTATLLIGGNPAQAIVEEYDGTSWTEITDLNAGNNASMCWGTSTSAVNAGGASPRTQVESWNGSSWTEVAEVNNGRYGGLGAGASNTSGMIFGGENPSPSGPHPGPYFSATEIWDGSSWTEVSEMNQARYGMLGGGATNTAAIGAGGGDPVPSYGGYTEIWDGSSWTEVANMNEKRMLGSGFGTSTSFIAAGSDPGGDSPYAKTESWDGSSWTQLSGDLSTARGQFSGGGSGATSGVVFGGRTPSGPATNSTEEWTASLANKTITAS